MPASTLHAAPAPRSTSLSLFLSQILSDREQFFVEVAESQGLERKIGLATTTLLVLSALYGAAAGAYAGPLQSVSAAIKLPLLFAGTLVICFPAFYVVQILVGSRLRLAQMLALVMGALSVTAVVLAAVVPVTVFFLLTGANYHFLGLLHVVIVLAAGLAGMAVLHEGLAYACEKRNVYPRKAMTIMKAWAVLFAFVGIQMAWNLRPFVGDRDQPFKVFRNYGGNFYSAIAGAVRKLGGEEERKEVGSPRRDQPSFPLLPSTPALRDSLGAHR